jgi:hypothetical protein
MAEVRGSLQPNQASLGYRYSNPGKINKTFQQKNLKKFAQSNNCAYICNQMLA